MIEIVRSTRSRYDREAGQFVVTHEAYVKIDGRRLSAEESRAMLNRAYDQAGARAPLASEAQ